MVKVCPRCGYNNPDDVNFCIKCGYPLNQPLYTQPQQYYQPPPPPPAYRPPYSSYPVPYGGGKSRSKLPIIGGIVLAVIVVLAVVFIVLPMFHNSMTNYSVISSTVVSSTGSSISNSFGPTDILTPAQMSSIMGGNWVVATNQSYIAVCYVSNQSQVRYYLDGHVEVIDGLYATFPFDMVDLSFVKNYFLQLYGYNVPNASSPVGVNINVIIMPNATDALTIYKFLQGKVNTNMSVDGFNYTIIPYNSAMYSGTVVALKGNTDILIKVYTSAVTPEELNQIMIDVANNLSNYMTGNS